MKIRMGFVTNSSGSSYTSIEIENKELCDILNKYIYEMKQHTNKRIEHPEITNKVIRTSSSWGEGCDEAAFWSGPLKNPETISAAFQEAMKPSIKKLNDKTINKIFDEMKKELKDKEELINNSYTKISLDHYYSGDLGGCATEKRKEEYNQDTKCPICKSPLVYKSNYYEHDEYNQKTDEYESIISDVESIECSNENCNFKVENKKK